MLDDIVEWLATAEPSEKYPFVFHAGWIAVRATDGHLALAAVEIPVFFLFDFILVCAGRKFCK